MGNILSFNNRVFRVLILILGLSISYQTITLASINKVDFQIKYDEDNCVYNCYIVILEGQAETFVERLQSSAQYSIVVPTGSTINQVTSYMPLKNNYNYEGTIPMSWAVSTTVISPEAAPESDFYGIVPILSPYAHYNNIYVGDTILLFSLDIDVSFGCRTGVRLFDNDNDPAPYELNGGNFDNGMTIGSPSQLYDNNIAPVSPPVAVVTTVADYTEGSIRRTIENLCCVDTVFFDNSVNNTPIILQGQIDIDKNIVIMGNGKVETCLDGANLNRMFNISNGHSLTLVNLTLQNGFEAVDGGAVFNDGTLIFYNVELKHNMEGNVPKAVTNTGSIVIVSDTVVKP